MKNYFSLPMLLKDFLPNPAFRKFVQRYTITDFAFDENAERAVASIIANHHRSMEIMSE